MGLLSKQQLARELAANLAQLPPLPSSSDSDHQHLYEHLGIFADNPAHTIYLLHLAAVDAAVRKHALPAVVDALSTLDAAQWGDRFGSDFGTAFVVLAFRVEAADVKGRSSSGQGGGLVRDAVVRAMEGLLGRVAFVTVGIPEVVVLAGLFDAVAASAAAKTAAWGTHARRLAALARRVLGAESSSSGNVPPSPLAASALKACRALVAHGHCGTDQGAVAAFADVASLSLTADAVCLLAACACADKAHRGAAVQRGLAYLCGVPALGAAEGAGTAGEADADSADVGAAAAVVAALAGTFRGAAASAADPLAEALAQAAGRACLHLHASSRVDTAPLAAFAQAAALALNAAAGKGQVCVGFLQQALELSAAAAAEGNDAVAVRVLGLVGGVAAGAARAPAVAEAAYTGLVDALAGAPTLAAAAATQLGRLAAAIATSTDDGGYLVAVIDTLSASVAAAVKRLSARSAINDKSGSSGGAGSGSRTPGSRLGRGLLAVFSPASKRRQSSRGTDDPPTPRPPAAAAAAGPSLVALEGLVDGLDALVAALQLAAAAPAGDPDGRVATAVVTAQRRIVELFVEVADDVYGPRGGASGGGAALGLLLKPLAAVFTAAGDGQPPPASCGAAGPVLRRLWLGIAALRLRDRAAWAAHPSWRAHAQAVAAHCPPLLADPSAAAPGLLDHELATNAVSQGLAVGSDAARQALAALRTLAQIPAGSPLAPGQLLLVAAVQLMETLRATGGRYDVRPALRVLAETAVDALPPPLRDALEAAADHVGAAFVDAVTARLRGSSSSSSGSSEGAAEEDGEKDGARLARASAVRALCFAAAHGIHRHAPVRRCALRLAGRLLDRFPWLVTAASCVAALLDTASLLAIHGRTVTGGNDDTAGSSVAAAVPQMLPFSALPPDAAGVAAAARPFLETAYGWLFSGMRAAPTETGVALQEYVLMREPGGVDSLGVALAREAATSRAPVFHLAPPTGDGQLAVSRKAAAMAIAAQLPGGGGRRGVAATFSSDLAAKARYAGEVQGATGKGKGGPAAAAAKARGRLTDLIASEAGKTVATVDTVVDAMWLCTTAARAAMAALEPPLSDESPSDDGVAAAALVEATRTVRLLSSAAAACFSAPAVDCLATCCRWLLAAAAVADPAPLRRAVAAEAAALLSLTATLRVGLFAPSVRALESGLVAAGTYAARSADFSGFAVHAGANADVASHVAAHVTLVGFCEELLKADATGACLPVLFDGVAGALLAGADVSAENADADAAPAMGQGAVFTAARFRLLCLGLRLLRGAVRSVGSKSSGGVMGPAQRRLMRERVVRAALQHFEAEPAFGPSQGTPTAFFALWDFWALFLEDTVLWGVEYPPSVSGPGIDFAGEQVGPSHHRAAAAAAATFVQRGRGPGAAGAITFLRAVMAPSALLSALSPSPVDACVLPVSLVSLQIELGVFALAPADAVRFAGPDRSKRLASVACAEVDASVSSAAMVLLRLLVLHELDRLAAWGGSHDGSGASAVPVDAAAVARRELAALAGNVKAYKLAACAAWAVAPALALRLRDRYPASADADGRRKGISVLCSLAVENPEALRALPSAAPFLLRGISSSAALARRAGRGDAINVEDGTQGLQTWAAAPVPVVVELLARVSALPLGSPDFHYFPAVVRYCARSLALAAPAATVFFQPQLVQLLRRDEFGALAGLLAELARASVLVGHTLVAALQVEAHGDADDGHGHGKGPGKKKKEGHGHCHMLPGSDPLPALAAALLDKVQACLAPAAQAYAAQQSAFFHDVTEISGKLRAVKDKDQHSGIIEAAVTDIVGKYPLGLIYMPTAPGRRVVAVHAKSGLPMQSAAKCPFLLEFATAAWAGPDSAVVGEGAQARAVPAATGASTLSVRAGRTVSLSTEHGGDTNANSSSSSSSPLSPMRGTRRNNTKGRLFTAPKVLRFKEDDAAVAAEAEEVTEAGGLAIKAAVADKSPPRFGLGNVFGLLSLSPVPPSSTSSSSSTLDHPSQPLPDVDNDDDDDGNDACIFKVYDDCRQDALVIQVVRLLRDAFAAAGLPLYLVPYTVVPSRVGSEFAAGGILQVVKHVKSRDQIAKGGAKDLVAHYTACFGPPGSEGYRAAQWAFVRSTAAYAIVCYLMWIKDRHNGNLLVDAQGHVVHIDYGFILGISPGGNLGFETAAFKLTPDMLALMGGLDAPLFATFVDLVVRGFLVARAHYRALADVVCAMADGGTPCFLRHVGDLERFRARFCLDMTSADAARFMENKVLDAAAKWTTAGYDAIQFAQNGIM